MVLTILAPPTSPTEPPMKRPSCETTNTGVTPTRPTPATSRRRIPRLRPALQVRAATAGERPRQFREGTFVDQADGALAGVGFQEAELLQFFPVRHCGALLSRRSLRQGLLQAQKHHGGGALLSLIRPGRRRRRSSSRKPAGRRCHRTSKPDTGVTIFTATSPFCWLGSIRTSMSPDPTTPVWTGAFRAGLPASAFTLNSRYSKPWFKILRYQFRNRAGGL